MYYLEALHHPKKYRINYDMINWRASEASETLSGVYKFELVRYVYIYIYICMEVRMSK